MTKKHSKNPWNDRDLNDKEENDAHEPAVEPGEERHSDDLVDKDIDQELDDLEEAEHTAEPEKNEWQEKVSQAHDQLMRAKAEIENIRRRAEQDVARAHKYALEKFVKELIAVVDSLEHALAAEGAENAVREGVELTYKMFLDVLAKHGVKQIDPVNEKFNPENHEAMSMQPSADVEPNTVLAVYQKGYLLNDRLVRPARVVVSKAE